MGKSNTDNKKISVSKMINTSSPTWSASEESSLHSVYLVQCSHYWWLCYKCYHLQTQQWGCVCVGKREIDWGTALLILNGQEVRGEVWTRVSTSLAEWSYTQNVLQYFCKCLWLSTFCRCILYLRNLLYFREDPYQGFFKFAFKAQSSFSSQSVFTGCASTAQLMV